MRNHFDIIVLDPYSQPAMDLLDASDVYLAALYPPESNHLLKPSDLAQAHVRFLGYQQDSKIVGCAAVRILEDEMGQYGEIKRLFVFESHRGLGISKILMNRLEMHLLEKGIVISRLETGIFQPEALGLFQRLGYVERRPFGDYVLDPLSVFMEKRLKTDSMT
jgi:putative acetyltransferase